MRSPRYTNSCPPGKNYVLQSCESRTMICRSPNRPSGNQSHQFFPLNLGLLSNYASAIRGDSSTFSLGTVRVSTLLNRARAPGTHSGVLSLLELCG